MWTIATTNEACDNGEYGPVEPRECVFEPGFEPNQSGYVDVRIHSAKAIVYKKWVFETEAEAWKAYKQSKEEEVAKAEAEIAKAVQRMKELGEGA